MRLRLTLLLFLFSASAFGQVSFLFVPEVYGRKPDGLFNCRIINSGATQNGYLTITVTERKGGIICQVRTAEFSVLPGSNPIPVSATRAASVNFASNRLGQLTAASRSFPEGDYDYCFALNYVHSDNPPEEQCFSYTLAPFAELNLIDPYNKDKICDKRPLLTWEPLIPGVPGSYYQLVLTEIQKGQSATEAMNYNLPLINQSNILSPILPYPSIAQELVNKKRYAWQVTAYKDQTILNRSDIWEFVVDCRDTVKADSVIRGYRSIDDLSKGNYYIAKGKIRFALVNPYQQQQLKYKINPLDDPSKVIKGLPAIKLLNGDNTITIDLSANNRFKAGKYYVLSVWLPDGAVKNLRFLYEQE
jgi:hypothetical protein